MGLKMQQIEQLFNDVHNQNSTQLVEVISRSENIAEHKITIEKSATNYDPIGEHLIELRLCYSELNNLIQEAEERKKRNKSARLENKLLKKVSLPKFPENYPFSTSPGFSNVHQPKIRNKFYVIGKEEVNKNLENSVERFLLQAGFSVVKNSKSNREAIKCLSYLTKKYLEMFVKMMKRNQSCKVFSGSKDLWGPLETTLREIEYDGIPGLQNSSVKSFMEIESMNNRKGVEFGGIAGLHASFYDTVVKKHDKLFEECEKLLEKYEKLLSELNVNL